MNSVAAKFGIAVNPTDPTCYSDSPYSSFRAIATPVPATKGRGGNPYEITPKEKYAEDHSRS